MKNPWEAVKSFFSNAFRGEDPQREMRWISPYPIAGLQLTPDQALSLSTVWGCIDIIGKGIASCAWNIYEPVPGTKRRKLLDSDFRAWVLNTRPNPEMTAIGFREAMLFQAIPFGNAYAEIVRDAGGRVTELWPLMSDRVMPRRNRETWALEYHYVQPDGSIAIFPSRKIFHLRGPGLWGLMGDNIIARAAKTLGVAAAQERYSASFFGQGAQPSGVLEFSGKLDPATHKRLKEDWTDKFKGPDNAHKPIILESGMKWNSISVDPQKSQLVESRKFSVEEICRWFGVPPHKVQHLEHATFSNIEHSSIEFVRDSLKPWERRLCQEADAKLFDQNRGPWRCTEIDLSPLTRGDAQSRSQAHASWRQNGIMTANEIRAQEGLDDCGEDGDILLVQANLTTVQRIVAGDTGVLDEELNPEVDDEDDTEGDLPEESDAELDDVASLKRTSIKAALESSFDRYARRLNNRTAALRSKPNRGELIASFKEEQCRVIAHEMSFFDDIIVSMFGRTFTHDDMSKMISMHERGEGVSEFVRALNAANLSTPKRNIDP